MELKYKVAENGNTHVKYKHLKIVLASIVCTFIPSQIIFNFSQRFRFLLQLQTFIRSKYQLSISLITNELCQPWTKPCQLIPNYRKPFC